MPHLPYCTEAGTWISTKHSRTWGTRDFLSGHATATAVHPNCKAVSVGGRGSLCEGKEAPAAPEGCSKGHSSGGARRGAGSSLRPGGLRRRLSARRYGVPPAAAGAGRAGPGRTVPGRAGPGRAEQVRRAGAPARAARRRVPSPWGPGRRAGSPRAALPRHPRCARPGPRHPRGSGQARPPPQCPGTAVPVDAGLSPGGAHPWAGIGPQCRFSLWLPAGAGSDPDTEVTNVPRSPCWHCQGPAETAGDGACCRACLAGNVWDRSQSPLLKLRTTNKNNFVVFAHI